VHILRLAGEPGYRRQIETQANLQEGRHALARKIFHGRAGQLYQNYHDGMEDQIGALGLVLNALVARGGRRSPLPVRAPPREHARPVLLPAPRPARGSAPAARAWGGRASV